jgi:tetratricopeptide (TPR) repeat protein
LAVIRKRPLISFAIGFFFINHMVESTILPLEMIFEHRNYLPSMFIFLPLSAGLHQLYIYYRCRNRFLTLIIPVFAIVVLTGFGIGTYIRNMSWASEKTLWEDAMLKAPMSSRPLHNLAWGHYEEIKDTRTALGLYLKSLTLRDDSISRDAATYNNLAIIYFNAGKHDEAIKLWQKAIRSSPKFSKMYYKISEALTKLGRYKSAERYLDIMMVHVPDTVPYLNLKGLILIKTGKPSDALEIYRKSLAVAPSNNNTWTHIGICLEVMGNHHNAYWFLKNAWTRSSKNPYILLWLSTTALSLGDLEKGRIYVKKLVDRVGPERISTYLKEVSLRRDLILPDLNPVIPVIAAYMEDLVKSVSNVENQLKSMLKPSPDV